MQIIVTDRGVSITVEDEPFASGTMKDVHRIEGGQNVLAVFREPLNAQGADRLKALVDTFRARIFDGPGGDELSSLFRWPSDTATFNSRSAVLVPMFEPKFFFTHGSVDHDKLSIRGKEKQGKWFTSAYHRNTYLHSAEHGKWTDALSICRRLAQAVRRLHAGGLAHSDLSYRNVLVDPGTGSACLIDIDGLVVPGKFALDVTGTPDFIAPEVVRTRDLIIDGPERIHHSMETDRHALAVLSYLYLTGDIHFAAGRYMTPTMRIGTKVWQWEKQHIGLSILMIHPIALTVTMRARPSCRELMNRNCPLVSCVSRYLMRFFSEHLLKVCTHLTVDPHLKNGNVRLCTPETCLYRVQTKSVSCGTMYFSTAINRVVPSAIPGMNTPFPY